MLNLQRQGCLAAFNKNGSGYNLDMFYLYVDSMSLDRDACAQKPNQGIYRAITQTSEGGLSVYYKGKGEDIFEIWCAWFRSHSELEENYGIDTYVGLITNCNVHKERYIFGMFF